MKENQKKFELSLTVQFDVVDSSKTADEREIFIIRLIRKIETTIRNSIANPAREDEGVTAVRSVQITGLPELVQDIMKLDDGE